MISPWRNDDQDAAGMMVAGIVGGLIAFVLTWGFVDGWSWLHLYGVYEPMQVLPSSAAFWVFPGVWILFGVLSGVLIARLQQKGCIVTLAVAVSLAVLYGLFLPASIQELVEPLPIVALLCVVPIGGLVFAVLWISGVLAIRWNLSRTIALAAPLILALLATITPAWLFDQIFSRILIGEVSAARAAHSIALARDLDVSRIEVETQYDYLAQADLGANIPSEFEVILLLAGGERVTCRFEWGRMATSEDCG